MFYGGKGKPTGLIQQWEHHFLMWFWKIILRPRTTDTRQELGGGGQSDHDIRQYFNAKKTSDKKCSSISHKRYCFVHINDILFLEHTCDQIILKLLLKLYQVLLFWNLVSMIILVFTGPLLNLTFIPPPPACAPRPLFCMVSKEVH